MSNVGGGHNRLGSPIRVVDDREANSTLVRSTEQFHAPETPWSSDPRVLSGAGASMAETRKVPGSLRGPQLAAGRVHPHSSSFKGKRRNVGHGHTFKGFESEVVDDREANSTDC